MIIGTKVFHKFLLFSFAIFIVSNIISIKEVTAMEHEILESKNAINFLPEGFVYLDQINDKIISNLMYNTTFNFVGEKIDGYYTNRVILTKEAAEKLNEAWKIFDSKGYNIVIYDAYRPQKAVDHFWRWGNENSNDKIEMKKYFYPRISPSDCFEQNYIARKSSHSRGNTVDLSIIKKGEKFVSFSELESLSKSDTLKLPLAKLQGKDNDAEIYILNDGTVDMGTSIDLLDEVSHPNSTSVSEIAQINRKFLIDTMENAGFKVYPAEWWHFTLQDESNKDIYHDFDIKNNYIINNE